MKALMYIATACMVVGVLCVTVTTAFYSLPIWFEWAGLALLCVGGLGGCVLIVLTTRD